MARKLCRVFSLPMICWMILGLLMGWLNPSESDARSASIPDSDVISKPPEFLLRPELIPVKGDGLPAVAEAERVVRSRR